ncbi:unnamed protein product [Clonostachys rosea f. rosea IK726]|uniref:Uncharacterized protein n=1 Tax=Clonostachys rosea f. rosea IK726 TaxID=1349383 RepID=A0ACA9UUJ9_BIOOC|nr:unnamed protein product [Clonostachys rosea f. rosea IK726]
MPRNYVMWTAYAIKSRHRRKRSMFYYSALAYFISEEETPDVLDRKMALDFYSRLLYQGGVAGGWPSHISPWGGKETSIDESALFLKVNYALKASTDHAVTMATLSFQHLAAAAENANVAFFHTSSGMVKTNGDRELNFVIRLLVSTVSYVFRPWVTSTEETGDLVSNKQSFRTLFVIKM